MVPRFTTMQTFGLHVLHNPGVKHMENYLHYGQLAAWPYLRVIRFMLRLENSLDEGLERLKSRVQQLGPDYDESDDLDSIASGSTVNALAMSKMNRMVRFASPSPQIGALQKKLSIVELENTLLRQEVEELRLITGRCAINGNQMVEEGSTDGTDHPATVSLSEGDVFNLVRTARELGGN